jgi:type VI secretion system protein ImpG
MNEKFLDTYNKELYYLREMGSEFAVNNPITAKYLNLNEFSCADPYVERLLEGVAFLSARVSHKLDAEFPRFTQSLINNIYPEYFTPIPTMGVAEFIPDFNEKELGKGRRVPKGTEIKTIKNERVETVCKFRTAHEVMLWPISISSAEYIEDDPVLKTSNIGKDESSIMIELKTHGGISFNELEIENLDFYIRGANEVKRNLYKLLFANCVSIIIQFRDSSGEYYQLELTDPKKQIRQLGYDKEDSLLINDSRVSSVYKNMREYFTFPNRFLFFRLDKINEALKQIRSDSISIHFRLNAKHPRIFNSVTKKNFVLYCTPMANLFEKRLERINYTDKKPEYLLTADKFRLDDYEILQLTSVNGYSSKTTNKIDCKPFYSASAFDQSKDVKTVYYTTNRVYSNSVSQNKTCKNGNNSILYISFVDFDALSIQNDIREVEVRAYCSNGTLPNELSFEINKKSDFDVELNLPIKGIKSIEPLAHPKSYQESNSDWRIINHLKLNYLSLLSNDSSKGAEVIQEILKLYADDNSISHKMDIDSIKGVSYRRMNKRIKIGDCISYINGVEVTVLFKEKFNGYGDCFILGSLLDKFFKSNSPINTFVETVICAGIYGEIMRWPALIE